tara:strand:+ start:469 stop:801 length:333 start_codon:yes stop_codon:yes gene_type:complete
MTNPAGSIYNRINSLIQLDEQRNNKEETKNSKGLLKRVSGMENNSGISKNKDLQFIKDIIVEIRNQRKEQLGVTDILEDDTKTLVTPAGKATSKEMKKELFKQIGAIQDA